MYGLQKFRLLKEGDDLRYEFRCIKIKAGACHDSSTEETKGSALNGMALTSFLVKQEIKLLDGQALTGFHLNTRFEQEGIYKIPYYVYSYSFCELKSEEKLSENNVKKQEISEIIPIRKESAGLKNDKNVEKTEKIIEQEKKSEIIQQKIKEDIINVKNQEKDIAIKKVEKEQISDTEKGKIIADIINVKNDEKENAIKKEIINVKNDEKEDAVKKIVQDKKITLTEKLKADIINEMPLNKSSKPQSLAEAIVPKVLIDPLTKAPKIDPITNLPEVKNTKSVLSKDPITKIPQVKIDPVTHTPKRDPIINTPVKIDPLTNTPKIDPLTNIPEMKIDQPKAKEPVTQQILTPEKKLSSVNFQQPTSTVQNDFNLKNVKIKELPQFKKAAMGGALQTKLVKEKNEIKKIDPKHQALINSYLKHYKKRIAQIANLLHKTNKDSL